MTKKKISLIQAIIQWFAILLLLAPISFIRYDQYKESLFEAAELTSNVLWTVVLVIFSLFALNYYVLNFVTDIKLLQNKYCIAISSVPLIVLYGCLIAINSYFRKLVGYSHASIRRIHGAHWGFYLISALYLSLIVLELFKHFYKFEEIKPKTAHTTINQNTSPIEEVKQLKELLDAGIITQEEFDAKKKQLLGL